MVERGDLRLVVEIHGSGLVLKLLVLNLGGSILEFVDFGVLGRLSPPYRAECLALSPLNLRRVGTAAALEV